MKRRGKLCITVVLSFLVVLYEFSASAILVQADGLNADEARVVSVLSGTFTYDGRTYQSEDGYLSAAKAYFSQDGVDLTADECSQLISGIQSNIGYAVDSGYLVLVPGEPEDQVKNDAKDPYSLDQSDAEDIEELAPDERDENLEATGKDNRPELNDKKDDAMSINKDSSPKTESNIKREQSEGSGSPELVETDDDIKNDINSGKIQDSDLENKKDTDSVGKKEIKTDRIIKETGLSFKKSGMTIVIMCVIYLLFIISGLYFIFAKRHDKKS